MSILLYTKTKIVVTNQHCQSKSTFSSWHGRKCPQNMLQYLAARNQCFAAQNLCFAALNLCWPLETFTRCSKPMLAAHNVGCSKPLSRCSKPLFRCSKPLFATKPLFRCSKPPWAMLGPSLAKGPLWVQFPPPLGHDGPKLAQGPLWAQPWALHGP